MAGRDEERRSKTATEKPSASRYIALANTLSIFIVTIGGFAAYIATAQEQFQNRVAQFSYVEVLRSAAALVDRTWDSGKATTSGDFCGEYGVRDDKCKSDEKKELAGVRLFTISGTSANPTASIDFAAIEIPFQQSENARDLLKRILPGGDEDDDKNVLRAIYIEFRGMRHGWPAVLIKRRAEPWSFHFSSWNHLWFLRGAGHGLRFSEPKSLDWADDLPLSVRRRVYDFNYHFFQVTDRRINDEILQTAREISGRPYTSTNLADAYQVVITRPAMDMSISGLPTTPRLLSILLPIVFLYTAVIFRSCVRFLVKASPDRDEPWLLLNAETLVERAASFAWYAAICLAGFSVFAAFVVFDREASYIFLKLAFYLTGEQLYQMRFTSYESFYFGPRGEIGFSLMIAAISLVGIYCCSAAIFVLNTFDAPRSSLRSRALQKFYAFERSVEALSYNAMEFLLWPKSLRCIRVLFAGATALAFVSVVTYLYSWHLYENRMSRIAKALQTLYEVEKDSVPRERSIKDRILDYVEPVVDNWRPSSILAVAILFFVASSYYAVRHRIVSRSHREQS